MTTPLYHSFRSPHTYFLLVGLAIGSIAYVTWLGLRGIVLLSGAVIVAGTIAFWIKQFPQLKTPSTAANLLQPEIFFSRLSALDSPLPEAARPLWRSTYHNAKAILHITHQIAQYEPALIPDLLETLHTVLELVEQFVEALQVMQQVRTPHYQQLAQQRLKNSQTRLQHTQEQLQTLHDQLALEKLERRSLAVTSGISERLQILVAENEKGILGD